MCFVSVMENHGIWNLHWRQIQWNLRIMDTLMQGQLSVIQGMSFIQELLLYPHFTLNLIKHWSNDMIQHSHSVFGRVKYRSSVDWTSDLAWHDASSDIIEEAVEACSRHPECSKKTPTSSGDSIACLKDFSFGWGGGKSNSSSSCIIVLVWLLSQPNKHFAPAMAVYS